MSGGEFVVHATGPRQVIAVGVPSFGRVSLYWAARFADLRWPMNTIGAKLFVVGQEVGLARNQIAAQALAIDAPDRRCSHLLFLDDDVLFHRDLLVRLLSHELPIVSGLYYQKHTAGAPLIFAAEHQGIATGWRHGDLIRNVSGHGMGLCLIRRDVLELLSQTQRAAGALDRHGYPDLFTTTRDGLVTDGRLNETEDIAFCRRVRERYGEVLTVDTSAAAFGWHYDIDRQRGYPEPQWEQFVAQAPITWPGEVTW